MDRGPVSKPGGAGEEVGTTVRRTPRLYANGPPGTSFFPRGAAVASYKCGTVCELERAPIADRITGVRPGVTGMLDQEKI